MMVYLDNAATTEPEFFGKDYREYWGNANTNYAFGREAKEALDSVREDIKRYLGVKTGKVLFCRSATEASNRLTDLLPYCVCSPYEHDSVYNKCHHYHNKSIDEWIDLPYGHYTFSYFHQYVNQMTGTTFNLERIAEKLKKVNTKNLFFCSDFTAAIGHALIPYNFDNYLDAVWFSGHKFHCEKGIGALWVSDRLAEYLNLSESSTNEYGMFHGTVNVPGAIALANALNRYGYNFRSSGELSNKYHNLYNYLKQKLVEKDISFYYRNNFGILDFWDFSLAINALVLPQIKNADALIEYLSSKMIYVGAGHSACSENEDYRVLEAFGLTREEAKSTIRVSFSDYNSLYDIDKLVNAIKEFINLYN